MMVFHMQDAWRCHGGVSGHTPSYTSVASEVMVFPCRTHGGVVEVLGAGLALPMSGLTMTNLNLKNQPSPV